MKSAYLYLNFVCNNDCLFCASDKTNRIGKKKREFTLAESVEFMDDAVDHGLTTLLINGGEPTIHKDIVAIVREGAKRFKNVHMASNGIRLAEYTFVQQLVEAGLNGIGLPLYSLRDETFDWLVQHPGALKLVRQGIENLFQAKQEFGLDILLKLLILKPNYQENPCTAQWIMQTYPQVDGISVSGLRVGEKALQRKDGLFVPYDVARPYTTKTIREIPFEKLSFDFVPLCGIDPLLVLELINAGVIRENVRMNRLRRPDGVRTDGAQPYHQEPCCLQCDVYDFCSKVHDKHADQLGYDKQLTPIRYILKD